MSPLISIIIPVYNVEKYIVDCLDSVYKQTYENIEIILVDDKGTDESIKVIQNYFKIHSEHKYKLISHEINSGLSMARNSGLFKAKGEYIFFLDSDDTLPENSIQLLVKSAIQNDSDITIGNLICIEQKTGERKNPFPIKTNKEFFSDKNEIFKSFCSGNWPVIAPNKLYKRIFLLENNLQFQPDLLHEDELWAFLCALKATKISLVKKVTYNYLFHETSIIFNKKKKNTDDLIYISQQIYSYYKKEDDKNRKFQIYSYYVFFSEQVLRIIFQHIKEKEYFKQSYLKIYKNLDFSFLKYFSLDIPMGTKKLLFMMNFPPELGYRFYRYRFYRKISSFFRK